jgi:hypothetical protein
MYSLVDAKLFYISAIKVHGRKQADDPYRIDTSNTTLVPRLC